MDQSEENIIEILKNLISVVEGAPSPGNISSELYHIWFEHAQKAATEGIQLVNDMEGFHSESSEEIPD